MERDLRRLLLHRPLEKFVPLREQLGLLQEHVRLPVRLHKPIWPTRSIAQGDSSSPKSLCAVLSPWSTEGSKFLFMDDRSIVAADEATLARDFDWETGALENASKRQVWRCGDNKEIQHMGILAVPDRPDVEIKPAAGWAKCKKCLKKIRACPDEKLRETTLELVCTSFFAPAKVGGAKRPLRRSSRSNSRWLCQGRFWCQNIELHPRFSSILVAVQRITEWDIQWSSFLWNTFNRFFEELDLTFEKFDAEKGVLFSRKVTERNKNVSKAFGRRRRVWSAAPDALHLIRTVCRSLCFGDDEENTMGCGWR